MQADKETAAQLGENEEVKNMVESRGWQIVRSKLVERIIDLQSVKNVDDSSPEKALADLRARIAAVDILNDWLKKDVEGAVEQFEASKESMKDTLPEDYIAR